MYLHGLESTSQSGKARLFAQRFPGMLTPDFAGDIDDRMRQLYPILGDQRDWTLIGSSFGGLMAAVFTVERPEQVRKLILLAPALHLPPFATRSLNRRCPVRTVLVHGTRDNVVPPELVRDLAGQVFLHLEYLAVDDDHRLHEAFAELDWDGLLE